MRRLFRGIVAAVVILSGVPLFAQMRGLGRIEGTCVDEGGAIVEGVAVKLSFVDGSTVDGKSDAKGAWQIAGVGRGEFAASFTKAGYQTKRVKLLVEKEIGKSLPVKIILKKDA